MGMYTLYPIISNDITSNLIVNTVDSFRQSPWWFDQSDIMFCSVRKKLTNAISEIIAVRSGSRSSVAPGSKR
jgi:hypothetical protein